MNFRRRRWTVGQLGPFTQSYYVIVFCIISSMSSGRLTIPNSLNVDSIMELAIVDLVSSSWSFLVSLFAIAFICLILVFSLNTRICDIKSVYVFFASSWSFNLNLFFSSAKSCNVFFSFESSSWISSTRRVSASVFWWLVISSMLVFLGSMLVLSAVIFSFLKRVDGCGFT